MRLGKLLARYREAAGIAQAEAARRAGVDRSHLSRVETGGDGRIPSASLVDRLARLYGLTRADRAQLLRMRAIAAIRGVTA